MNILEKIRKLLPQKTDNDELLYFKTIIYIILGLILLSVVVGLLIFFLNLDELEKTKIPDVSSNEYNQTDIINAGLALQERGLNMKIQVRHSSMYARGIVIDQKPRAGSYVKVGRSVTLTVSNGPVLNKVGNYIGENITDVRLTLEEAFASGTKAILQIQEPVEFDYSQSVPADHIIEQSPPPGTDLIENKVTYLKLVVSMGQEKERRSLDSYLGLEFSAALERVYNAGIPFIIDEETDANSYKPRVITYQEPAPGEVLETGKFLKLKFNPPKELDEDEVFGYFETLIREYDVPVPVRLEVHSASGERVLYSAKQRGGELRIPYIVEENSEIVLYVLDEVVEKEIVQAREEG